MDQHIAFAPGREEDSSWLGLEGRRRELNLF